MTLERLIQLQGRLSRRDFLARMATATGAGLIGCKNDGTDPGPTNGTLDNIIVVTMENRSYDHLLGWLPGGDGKQAGLFYTDRNGVRQPTHHLTSPDGCGQADPNHSAAGGRVQFNNGACDGWLKANGSDLSAIGYYTASDLSFFGQAAPQWTVLDRYFSPFLGPTFPNRIISQAGQTDRISNTQDISTLPTIWDRLSAGGLTGGNYGSTPLQSVSFWGLKYLSIRKSIDQFYTDAAAGNLPNVSFIDPDLSSTFTDSYHPPGDIRNAEAFMGSIYKAVTTGPQWKSSLLIFTFDEWGGFYDHVAPTVAPHWQRPRGHLEQRHSGRIPLGVEIPAFPQRQERIEVGFRAGLDVLRRCAG